MSGESSVDLILTTDWIIPVVPRGRVLRDCSLAIRHGKIVALGLTSEITSDYQPEQHIQLSNHVLIPGLINAHGHIAMSLLRGYADDKPLMQWLQDYIWPAEQTWVSEAFVHDGARLAVAEMLASGTTCFADMYFYPEISAAVAVEAGIRAHINFPVLDFPSVWASNPEEYLRKGIALHDQYRAHELINVGFGPHAPYTVSDEPLRKIATYAEELQATIHIHLHETAHEVTTSLEQHGKRPIERLNDLGLLSPLTHCVHMTQVTDEDIALLQASGAHVIHCPESNMKLASGITPVTRLLRAGVNVCLGTDGAASNNDLDLFGELQSAALLAKVESGDAAAVDAATALEMATINGARALGLEDEIGSLEVDKWADIVAVDLSGLQHQPLYDPIGQLAYTRSGHCVSDVWVQGRPILRDYRHTSLDIEDIRIQTKAWQQKLGVTASDTGR